jgi:hypothetical protein
MRCRSVRPTQQFLAQKFVCDNLEFRENELVFLSGFLRENFPPFFLTSEFRVKRNSAHSLMLALCQWPYFHNTHCCRPRSTR